MSAAEHTARYLTAFEDWQSAARKDDASWVRELRQAGVASLSALGFPTTRQEDWKYTNVEPLVARQFTFANGEARSLSRSDVLSRAFIDAGAPRLVFVNGVHAPHLSSVRGLPDGVQLVSLAESLKRDDDVLASRLARHADHRRNAFVALNTAFMDDGAVLIIPPGTRMAQPIYLIYASSAPKQATLSHPRTLILLGADSEVSVVESYAGIDGENYFCNAVTELVAEANATAHHYRLQNEAPAASHVGTLAAHLGRDCRLTAHALTLSGALVRNDVHVALDGEGAECVLNGLYIGAGKQHVDNYTEIEHVKPRATSWELYKGILDDASHGVFNGKIVVHKDAQKSDARQTNRNLLLSAEAVVNTKPQLEIYADDVKCSHGSTIGQLDPDALFYLRSRGLGPEEARSLLSFAFAADIVGRVKAGPLRQRLDDYLVARFRSPDASHEGHA
ncbi:MAG TPA: Fe-S cluster assembly protein SufD [Candidatus Binatia bacterium]|nr:Fe-S cluster assembly protein SufD [Candidatus Binatia bacterium]